MTPGTQGDLENSRERCDTNVKGSVLKIVQRQNKLC